MASIRLTNDLRNKIRKVVIDRRFTDRQKELKEQQHALALKVYATFYTPEVVTQMKALPEGMFIAASSIAFASPTGYMKTLCAKELMPMGCNHYNSWGPKPMYTCKDNTDPIWLEFHQWDTDTDALARERRDATQEVNEILSNFTTVAKLFTAWPELESLVDHLIPQPVVKKNLPALPTTRLNEEYKLPVGTLLT